MIKKTARFLALAAIFLVPVFPLIIANPFFFPFITGKAFYFRILVEVALAAWLILAFLDAKYRPKWTPLTIGIGIFTLVTLAADLLGVNPLRSIWSNFERMEGWLTIAHLGAFFLVTTNIFGSGEEGKRMWHRFLNVELFIALIVGIYGLFQFFGWAAIHQGSSRIDASLGNAAYMAVYMLWNAGLAAYMFLVAKARQINNASFLRWAYLILALLFAFEVFETSTRGTILGLVGGAVLALLLYVVFGKKESRKSRGVALGGVALIVLVSLVFWANRHQPFIQNNETLQRMASISWEENKTQARGYIWPMAVKGFAERPILGWGQENFNYIFNANYEPKMWNQEQWFDRAHSVFLDWLTASGIVGLLAYLSLYILFLFSIWRSSLTVGEKSILTGLLAGYAVHNIFVFDNLASYVLFFTALGFADSLRPGRPIKMIGDKPMPVEAVEYVALPVIIIVLIFGIYFLNVRVIKANTGLIRALQACGSQPDVALFEKVLAIDVYTANQEIREQLLSCASGVIGNQQVPGPTKQAFYDLANKAITDQIAATPMKDARIYTLGGSFLNVVNQSAAAVALLQTAHELSPAKQSISLQLGISLINSGKAAEAVDILKAAYDAAPDNVSVKSTYVVALIIAGKDAAARQMFADDTGIFQSPQVAQAYMAVKDYSKALDIYQALLKIDPKNAGAAIQLAQAQYTAGQLSAAVATLRQIAKDHPEYKDQIDASIKEIQK
ncbi:MAG: O-antigen ligase family protein [Candidatus Paceibacterota bacterium]